MPQVSSYSSQIQPDSSLRTLSVW